MGAMMKQTIQNGLATFEGVVAGCAMVTMASCMMLQVSARFLFNIALPWTDEVAMFAFVWAALMGVALAANLGGLHRIDMLVRRFPPILRRSCLLLVFALSIATLWVLIYYGVELVEVVHRQRSSILKVPMSYIYVAVPFASFLMMLSMLLDWRYALSGEELRSHSTPIEEASTSQTEKNTKSDMGNGALNND